MEFKIDTRSNFCIIRPLSANLDAIMTEELRQKWKTCPETSKGNIIVDFSHCTESKTAAWEQLIQWHEEVYAGGQSLVLTGLSSALWQSAKDQEMDLQLNIAPTMKEAVDIISMEILERDLFNEES